MSTPQFDINTLNIPGAAVPGAPVMAYPGVAPVTDPTAYTSAPAGFNFSAPAIAVPEQTPPPQIAPGVIAAPQHMSTNPGQVQQTTNPYTLTTTVGSVSNSVPQVNLPMGAIDAASNPDEPSNVIEAEAVEEARIRYFEPTEHTAKDPSGKDIKYSKIAAKYMVDRDVDEFYVNLCELVAPDGIRSNTYEKKDERGNVLLDKNGKPISSTECSIRVSFLKSNEKHAKCLNGLNTISRALVKALYAHRHRVGLGDFDPERSGAVLKPLAANPVDKNTGVPLDLPPSMYLKVHKGKRTNIYYGEPGPDAILMSKEQADLLIDRQIVFIPTLHIKGLYIGSKASIQSSVVSLFVIDIGSKIDPTIYKKTAGSSVTEASVAKLKETIAKLTREQEERKKQDQAQAQAKLLEAPPASTHQIMAPIPAGGNGFSGLPGGQVNYGPNSTPSAVGYGQPGGGVPAGYGYPGSAPVQNYGAGPAPNGGGYNPMATQQMPGPPQGQGYGNPMAQGGYGGPQNMQAFTAGAPQRFN